MRWFKDEKGQYSHTKFFSVVGYFVLNFAFVWQVIHGGDTDSAVWMLYAVATLGNRTINKVFEAKYNKGD